MATNEPQLKQSVSFEIDGARFTYSIEGTQGQLAPAIRRSIDRYHISLEITEVSTGARQQLALHAISGEHLDTDGFVRNKLGEALTNFNFGEIPKTFDREPDPAGSRFCIWC